MTAPRGPRRIGLLGGLLAICALGTSCTSRHLLGRLDEESSETLGGLDEDASGSADDDTAGSDGADEGSSSGSGSSSSDTGTTEPDLPTSGCKQDDFEPNDSPAAAADAGFIPGSGVDLSGSACAGDEDWYLLPVSAETVLSAEIALEGDIVPIEMGVLDAQTLELVCRYNGSDPMVCGISPGDYLLRVAVAPGEEPELLNYQVKLTV